MNLKGKTIVLGITGSIAAYKAADLASQLTRAGARVDVIMTDAAMAFVTPITLRSITGRPVITKLFKPVPEYSIGHIGHIDLADAADVVVIAPITANTIAKLAAGIADNILTCTVLATKAPVILSPAMHTNMYQNPVTQQNLGKLRARDFIVVGPEIGPLASGKIGMGRFIDVNQIIVTISQVLDRKGELAGKHIVISAGGTREPIDPVRCLTNYSSGKMGYALAEAARDRGAKVTLITAPTALPRPGGIDLIDINTAQEMYRAVKKTAPKADALIMAAAVADFQPVKVSKNKIKRQTSSSLTLELKKTPDILDEVRGDFIRVGFAAESDNILANAKDKLKRKQLDLIVANDITVAGSGIGADYNQVIIIDRKGRTEELPILPKRDVADKILDRLASLLK